MIAGNFTEDTLEKVALAWFESLGYKIFHGPDITASKGEQMRAGHLRAGHSEVTLDERLKASLIELNPDIPADTIDEVFNKVRAPMSIDPLEDNRIFHRMCVEGVEVETQREDGSIKGEIVKLIDFENPYKNNFYAINQLTVVENKKNRRPDVVVFVNGLPLAVIELKNAVNEDATTYQAYNQLQTYKKEIPSLFRTNAMLVISDGIEARMGSLTADKDRFMPWRTIDGETIAPKGSLELETLLKGVFDKETLLDFIQNFIVFEENGATLIKKIAAYHQYHAVNKAVECTVLSSSDRGNKKAGVIWHTQGSGKSLSMVFYAGKIIKQEEMKNPTLVILTDRNDLDNQLFATFCQCEALFRQTPSQAEGRKELQELLSVASGGVVFTTIQKFFPENKGEKYPELSNRRNIVVIADEAHRSQYDFLEGYADHMRDGLPSASFIGFTGTPIELSDKNTYGVFGKNIHTYDIHQSVEDGATVSIYYASRLAKIELDEEARLHLEKDFQEVTEGEEIDRKERLKSKWARLEALVGAEERINLIAQDIVDHFEARLEVMDGKAMVVCMSRRICVDLYNAIIKLRPEWHNSDDEKGFVKVVMTGSASDPEIFQPHVRSKAGRDLLARRAKDPSDPLKLVIVRDMWLTGFDSPPMHTMYVDKPMKGHSLMQAIARVNRVFRNKPGGLVVDYLGIADHLKKALAHYSDRDRSETGILQEEAIGVMIEKCELVKELFRGFDYTKAIEGTSEEKLRIILVAMEHILSQEEGREQFMQLTLELSKAFALCAGSDEAREIRGEMIFFQHIRSVFSKATSGSGKDLEDMNISLQQLVSKAVSSTEIVDIFEVAGLKNPDISILSDEFLAEVRGMSFKNLAFEMLKKLLRDEIKIRAKKNVVQARNFTEMLEKTIRKYQGRLIEVAEVIEELIDVAKEMREAKSKGEELGLNEDETAFYDALADNKSAQDVLGDGQLREIACELVDVVRKNTTIDWTVKESARAKIRVVVKRILRKYGYPPDMAEKATDTVLEQAELLSTEEVE